MPSILMHFEPPTDNLDAFLHIESLWQASTTSAQRVALLESPRWSLQQAALMALRDRPDPDAVPAILRLLRVHDQLDLYRAPNQRSLDGAPSESTREIWRCRFRVKQAALLALGAIGATHGERAVGDEGMARLHHDALDHTQDFVIRVAACHALRLINSPRSRDVLTQASRDSERCTATEASKGLATMPP
jgi:HEAT repeat protein